MDLGVDFKDSLEIKDITLLCIILRSISPKTVAPIFITNSIRELINSVSLVIVEQNT